MTIAKPELAWALAFTLTAIPFISVSRAADASAPDTKVQIQDLEQQIQSLQQEVHTLERKEQGDEDAAGQAAQNAARLTVGANGVIFSSANSNFVASLHGWLQVDSRTFFQNNQTAGIDGFLLRRARLIYLGTIFQNFDYNLTPEFAGSSPQMLDAYLNYHYSPALQLQVGKFKPPVGLEHLQQDVYTSFNERSLATDLVPYRSEGAELHGDLLNGSLSYAAGIFNGLPDYNSTTINANYDNDMAFAGRLFALPFKNTAFKPLQGLGVGVAGSYEHDDNIVSGLTPGFNTDGQEKFFAYNSTNAVANGEHWRISPQGYYYWGPFGLMGEYVISDQEVRNTSTSTSADLQNSAWEITGGWVLTGEPQSYSDVLPRHPFNPLEGGWGAWQLVARYAELDVDKDAFPTFANSATSASRARAWAVGLNWYLNQDLRANVSFSHTLFTGGANNAVTKQSENVMFTRMQLAF